MNQIRHTTIGDSFRLLREKKGLSQETVAKAAGIGRSTLVHLENGADVRLSKIAAVAKVLEAGIEAGAEPREFAERRLARLQLSMRMMSLQKTHLRIALDLLLDTPRINEALDDARDMVELWAREQVCSPFYIDSWRRLLTGSAHEVGTALARMDKKWESALLQNSPFGALLNQPA